MKKLFVILFSLLVVITFLKADYVIKQKTHMDGFEMMGQKQPATDEETENWIGKNKMLTHQRDKTYIIRADQKKMYIVMKKSKSYIEVDLPFDVSALMPPEAAQMMGMMKMTLTVTPTTNTKKINKWNCTEYKVEMKMMMGTINMSMWSTSEVGFDLKAYMDMYVNVSKMGFIENIDEFKKIKGYPIQTDISMNMMGTTIKGYTTVIDISEKTAPAGTYSPPTGYEKKDKLSIQDLR